MKPRIRTVKPEVAFDEELWDLGLETGLPVFQAFVVLWCHADREGRFEWRPRALKANCLPYWEGDFSRVLDALASRGFLVKYACESREYGLVRTFAEHQHINNKEPESSIPGPHEDGCVLLTELRASRVNDASEARAEHVDDVPIPSLPFPSRSQGGAGGVVPQGDKPKRKASARERATRLPSDWQPTPEHAARAKGLGVDLARETERFRNYAEANATRYVDWGKAFANWLLKAEELSRPRQAQNNHRRQPDDPRVDITKFGRVI